MLREDPRGQLPMEYTGHEPEREEPTMSKRKGRKNSEARPPSERRRERESAESVAFRELMDQDQQDVEFISLIERHAEERPDHLDLVALGACCRYLGLVQLGDARVIAVGPLRECHDHSEFDRLVSHAGLKRFIRRPMRSDYPGGAFPSILKYQFRLWILATG
jgi:hypothetical protein